MSTLKSETYRLLDVGGETFEERLVDWGIMLLIAVNIAAVILSTVDPLYQSFRQEFLVFELFSVTVFSAEYLGRIWSATEEPGYENPIAGRLRFALRPMLLIDLLAILPFFFGILIDLRFLRALRLFRFLRLFKLARYSETILSFKRVVYNKKEDLVMSFAVTTLLLVLSSSMMYFFERGAQPETFSSIPASFWWGVVTLTTVGYGDVYPVTVGGRIFGSVIAFLGVGLFALPASILASGFIEESGTGLTYCPHCGERLPDEE